MHRCLVPTECLLADRFVLGRAASRHLRTVLRVRQSDAIELFDGRGRSRRAVVEDAGKDGLSIAAAGPAAVLPPPAAALTLFACINKRMDWTVEKAVELGAARIVPVLSERTVIRIAPGERRAKAGRWLRIAEEAARQSGAARIPEIAEPLPLGETLAALAGPGPVFVGALDARARPFRAALEEWKEPPAQAGWYVGPEGDLSPGELDALLAAGGRPVSLGPAVLRSETACLYGLCVLNCAFLGG